MFVFTSSCNWIVGPVGVFIEEQNKSHKKEEVVKSSF